MTKSKIVLVLIVALVLAGMLAMAVPGAASADVLPVDYAWREPKYSGYDDYYGANVVEYTEGSTAHLSVWLYNSWYSMYGTGTVVSATLKTDWGGEYATTSALPIVDYNEGTTIEFSFTVPSTSVATNAWTHEYDIVIEYVTEGYQHWYSFVSYDWVATGDGTTLVFPTATSYAPVAPGSVKLWDLDTVGHTSAAIDPLFYTVALDGTITFGAGHAPANGHQIYAQYVYGDYIDQGDGVTTQFDLGSAPIAPDTETIYIWNSVTSAYTTTTAYSIDYEAGVVTFTNAPMPWEYVYASFEWWESSSWYGTWGNDNFVVLSADQADARDLGTEWENKYNFYSYFGYPSEVGARNLLMESLALANEAWDAWDAGEFAAAKTAMQSAVDKLQASIDAEVAYDQQWQDWELVSENAQVEQQKASTAYTQAQAALMTAEAANVPKEGLYLDAETAKLNAETARLNALTAAEKAKLEAQAKEAKGHGAMWANLGVFTILVGVALLLGAIGLILWAYSRLVAARAPKQI